MRRQHLAHKLDDPGRRQFLSNVAKAAFGVTALPFFNALGADEPYAEVPFVRPRATRVINLFMSGGMPHMDTFDPKPALAAKGASKLIGTSADSMFGEQIPNLASLAHEMTVIRSMFSNQGAHEQGQYYMRTGYKQVGTAQHPILGTWADAFRGKRNTTLPSTVVIGGGSTHPGGGFFPSSNAPLQLGSADDGLPNCKPRNSPTSQRYQRRHQLLEDLEQAQADKVKIDSSRTAYRELYEDAVALMNSRDLKAFDIQSESAADLAEYGDTRFGLGCALARRLIEHDVRHVEVTMGGWDSHADHADSIAENLPQFDKTASTLIKDLRRRGLLDSTIVMITTEFGRTPDINSNRGRDHHPGVFSCAVAGGPFKRGHIHGSSDARANMIGSKKVLVPDLHATVAYALGLPLDHIVYSPDGRPFTVGDKGEIVQELFA